MRHIYAVIKQIKRSNAVTYLGGLVGNPASAPDPQETLELDYYPTRVIA